MVRKVSKVLADFPRQGRRPSALKRRTGGGVTGGGDGDGGEEGEGDGDGDGALDN